MATVKMRRAAVNTLFATAQNPHAGLWLSRGLAEWKEESTPKGEDFQQHIKQASSFNAPDIYELAFKRWQAITMEANTIASWCGQLENRLFIGMGSSSVLETAITLSKTYGVPMIPGSAVKGLTRAYAEEVCRLKPDLCQTLFGHGGEEKAESGAVLFHDAWWVVNSARTPLVAEVVTVHHQAYYSGTAPKATDFDSPVPTSQIAAQGSFLFAVECGEEKWANYICQILAQALREWGIGGKTAAGYGRFRSPIESISEFRQEIRNELEKLGVGGAGKAGDWLTKAEKETDKEKAKEIALELKRYYQKALQQWDSTKPKEQKRQARIEALLSH